MIVRMNNDDFHPFDVSPETSLRNDLAHRDDEIRRVLDTSTHTFTPAPLDARCNAWSNERRLVGCTKFIGHSDAHANHTIPGWEFTNATMIDNRNDWVAYVDATYPPCDDDCEHADDDEEVM